MSLAFLIPSTPSSLQVCFPRPGARRVVLANPGLPRRPGPSGAAAQRSWLLGLAVRAPPTSEAAVRAPSRLRRSPHRRPVPGARSPRPARPMMLAPPRGLLTPASRPQLFRRYPRVHAGLLAQRSPSLGALPRCRPARRCPAAGQGGSWRSGCAGACRAVAQVALGRL